MTISDLISELEKIRESDGDMEIFYDFGDNDEREPELQTIDGRVLIQGKTSGQFWF